MPSQTPTPYDKRILKAHKKRYMEDKNLSQIAEEMGYSYKTIEKYFSSEASERIRQLYDEDELEFLRLQVVNEAKDAKQNSKSYISKAIKQAEEDPNAFLRAAREERETIKDFIKMLQELSLLQKPKERKEVQETSKDMTDVQERLQEAYQDQMEAEASE